MIQPRPLRGPAWSGIAPLELAELGGRFVLFTRIKNRAYKVEILSEVGGSHHIRHVVLFLRPGPMIARPRRRNADRRGSERSAGATERHPAPYRIKARRVAPGRHPRRGPAREKSARVASSSIPGIRRVRSTLQTAGLAVGGIRARILLEATRAGFSDSLEGLLS